MKNINTLKMYLPFHRISLNRNDVFTISNLVVIPDNIIDREAVLDSFCKNNPYVDIVEVKDLFEDDITDIKKNSIIGFFTYNQKDHLFGFPPFSPWKETLKDPSYIKKFSKKFIYGERNLDISFTGDLYDYQKDAVEWWRNNKGLGVIQGLPGSGKTIVGINIISKVKRPVVVLVHTKELLYQWKERLLSFTNLDEKDIGLIGDSKKDISPKVNIALFQTLWRDKDILDKLSSFPFLIVDEVHRVGAPTFLHIVGNFKSRYRLGLTATPYRTDQLGFMIYWLLGNGKKKMDSHVFFSKVYLLRTGFRIGTIPNGDYYTKMGILKRNISSNKERIKYIVNIIKRFHKNRNMFVALATKKEVDNIYKMLIDDGINDVSRLHSGIPKKERTASLNSHLIIATLDIIKEGLDIPDKDMMIIASPFQSRTLLEQLVGRIMRPSGLKPIVIDLIDESYPKSFLKDINEGRIKKYKIAGHEIMGFYDDMEDIAKEENL